MFLEEYGTWFFVSLCCEFDANTFEVFLVLVIEVLLSSGFALIVLCFIRLWASAFCLGHSLKSKRVGPTQCFLNAKSDHNSFLFSGTYCIAWLGKEALFKVIKYSTALNNSDDLIYIATKNKRNIYLRQTKNKHHRNKYAWQKYCRKGHADLEQYRAWETKKKMQYLAYTSFSPVRWKIGKICKIRDEELLFFHRKFWA